MTLAYYGKSRQRQALLAIVTFFAIAIGVAAGAWKLMEASASHADSAPISGKGVTPKLITDNNPTCGDLDDHFASSGTTWSEFSTGSSPIATTYDAGGGRAITISNITIVSGNMTFDWSSNFGVDAVFVKQGAGDTPNNPSVQNLYVYDPGIGEQTSDTGLGPKTGGQQSNGISHVAFCYDGGEVIPPAPTITKAAASTSLSGGNAIWEISVQNNSQTAMAVVVNDTDAKFGAVVSGGTCPTESTGNSSPFECNVNGSSTLKFSVTKPASNNTCEPTTIKNKASVTWWNGSSSQTSADTSEIEITIPVNEAEVDCDPVVLKKTVQVCKVIDDNGDNVADNGTFGFTISGGNPSKTSLSLSANEDSQTTYGSPDCDTFTVDEDSEVTITEGSSRPAGWTDASGYPKYQLDDNSPSQGSSVTLTWDGNCYDRDDLRAFDALVVEPDCLVTFHNKKTPQAPRKQFLVCKVVDDNGVLPGTEGGTFTVTLSGGNVSPTSMTLEQTEGGALAVGSSCEVATADEISTVTISEAVPGGWSSSAGYPKHKVNSAPLVSNDSNLDYDVQNCSDKAQPGESLTRASEDQSLDSLPDLCRVTFYNRTDGRVAAAPNLTVRKVIDFNGNGIKDGADYLDDGWTMTASCALPAKQTGANGTGTAQFPGTAEGTCTVTETTKAGYNALVKVTKLDSGFTTNTTGSSVTVTQNPDDNNVVTFFNQPLGSIAVTKTTVSSHNFGPDVTVAADLDGWKITVSSVACNYAASKSTDGNGIATFTDLPICSDYIVSEDLSSPGAPGYTPVGQASVSGRTPANPAAQVAFKNRKTTNDPPCTTCTLVIPTPTTVPPTATPVPPTATPKPTEKPADKPIDAALGERTPGALSTPIAPSTGTGTAGTASTFNGLLALVGLAVLGSGLAIVAVGRKQR